jgi:hypothetical protein
MNSQMLLGPNGLVYAIKEPDDYVRLYWGPLPFYCYKQNDPEGMKIGLVMLANQGMSHQSIGELFGVNRHTVGKIQTVYEKSGIEGLRNHHQGPERIDEATCAFVITEYARLNGGRGYQKKILDAIAEKAKEGIFPCTISRSKMQKIIQAHKEATKKRHDEEKKEAELKKGQKQQGQSRLQEKEAQAGKDSGQSELELFKERVCVEHGGAAAVIPLLGQLGLGKALPEEPEHGDKLYTIGELAVSFAALNAARLVDVEQGTDPPGGGEDGHALGDVEVCPDRGEPLWCDPHCLHRRTLHALPRGNEHPVRLQSPEAAGHARPRVCLRP